MNRPDRLIAEVGTAELMGQIGRAASRSGPQDRARCSRAEKRALLARGASDPQFAPAILAANAKDVEAARARGTTNAFIDRLTLNESRVAAIARSLEEIAGLNDPVGSVIARWQRPNGLIIDASSCAFGRHRHHLREPAQRNGRRRSPLPEERERGDPARRIGKPALEPCHPRLPRRGSEGSRVA